MARGLCGALHGGEALALLVVQGVLLGLPPGQQAVVVAFAALPTASSAYVLAARMGGHGGYVAGLVTLSTLIAMVGNREKHPTPRLPSSIFALYEGAVAC